MDNRPVKIYCSRDVTRLRYIAGLILGEILGLKWDVVTDKRRLGKCPVINYSEEDIADAFKITPADLLLETGVRNHDIQVSRWKGLPVFFSVTESDLPFDVFAASFYLVTRYEEYLDTDPDECAQFRPSSSVAHRNGFLGIPVVDLWAKEFAKVLLKKFPTLTFKRNEFKALLVVDADQPFPEKSFFSSVGNLLMDLKNRKIIKRESQLKKDGHEKVQPDEFDYIIENIKKSDWEVKFFFPVGDHSSSEKHPSWKNNEYRHLIRKIAETFETGLKPSNKASCDYTLISSELTRLKSIVAADIFSSRFQPIKTALTNSYLEAYKASIRNDYSMGYPEEPGFRASIARSFIFYDLTLDKVTDMRIFPFQVMDKSFSRTGGEEKPEIISKLMTETRNAGGLFVCIWHNSSLSDCEEMKMRRETFEQMLKS